METITCCGRCLWMQWLIVINTCFLCWSEEIISDCIQVERNSYLSGEEKKKPSRFVLLLHKANKGFLQGSALADDSAMP